jgi:molecular chaperone GrpE
MSASKKNKDKCNKFKTGAASGEKNEKMKTHEDAPLDETQEFEEVCATEEAEADMNAKLAEMNDKYLRLQAEFQNYRKRTAKEVSAARLVGQVDALTPFLQVFDHFNMAVTAAETAANMDAIRDGLKMILSEFSKAIDELGIEKIDAVGKAFDPNLHEAMANEPSDEVEEGVVIKQWTCGYRMGDRLLRPANVVVSSGKEG